MKSSRSDRIASLVLLATIVLLMAFVWRLASRHGWTEGRTTVEFLLHRGHGLETGSEVRVMGLSGGRVDSLDMEVFDGSRRIRVVTSIPNRLASNLSPMSTAVVVALPGERPRIDIDPGPLDAIPESGTLTLACKEPEDRALAFDAMVESGRAVVEKLDRDLGPVLTGLRNVVEEVEGAVGNFQKPDSDMGRIIKSARTVAENMERPSQRLARLTEDADAFLRQGSDIMDALRRSWILNKLIQEKEFRPEDTLQLAEDGIYGLE
ncbi:MAG: MlaD family protein [Planctomycetota bacterium]